MAPEENCAGTASPEAGTTNETATAASTSTAEAAMMRAMTNVVSAGNVSSTTMRAFDDKEMEAILK